MRPARSVAILVLLDAFRRRFITSQSSLLWPLNMGPRLVTTAVTRVIGFEVVIVMIVDIVNRDRACDRISRKRP